MRYIIYGAGGIGGGIGARLFQHGHEVVLIARGAHLEQLRSKGLTLRTPDETVTLPVAAVGHPSEIDFVAQDVVLLTMKSQDTLAALDDLRATAGVAVPVICAQNGVANELTALRRFPRVYGMLVLMPATFLDPGEVILHSAPMSGVLDAGRYPEGVDALIEEVCDDLTASSFSAKPDPNVMRQKYEKLLTNLVNAVVALLGLNARSSDIMEAVRAEAVACYEAAGIQYEAPGQWTRMRGGEITIRDVEGAPRLSGSTWQSLARGRPSIETDYMNGEIVLLGAMHGVPTPYNRMLQTVAHQAAREGRAPGSYSVEELSAIARDYEQAGGD